MRRAGFFFRADASVSKSSRAGGGNADEQPHKELDRRQNMRVGCG